MSSHPTLDDLTAQFVRDAMAQARAGRVDEARAIAERGLADGADSGVLHAMLGAIHSRHGNFSAAIGPLMKAAELRPDDSSIKFELVSAFIQEERYAEAVAILPDDAVNADPTMNLLRQRAYAAHMDGQLDRALDDYRRFLDANPSDWESWNNLGNAYRAAENLDAAVESLRTAARLNPGAAPIRLNLARSLRDSGDLEGAASELRKMARDFPADEKPLIDLYHVLQALGRPEGELEETLLQACVLDPLNVDLLIGLGDLQVRNLAFDKAEASYRRALASLPSSGNAYFGLARTFEHSNPSELVRLVKEAGAALPDDDAHLNLVRAFTARRAKDYAAGLEALERVPDEVESAVRWHLAGQLCEALGQYDEAFAAFTEMNHAHAADPSEPILRAAELRKILRSQYKRMTKSWLQGWSVGASKTERASPVFLVGFPRSGTTLLDTILMGHPGVAVLEEQPLLKNLSLATSGFDNLPSLGESDVERLQRQYFTLAEDRVGPIDQKLLVDKSPLHLHRVPQIMRLFPDARFILALRHPADAVLSCFKSNFRLNNAMSNFLTLENSAEFYDLTFKIWERACRLFAPQVMTVRYEHLVDDPEAVLRPLVEGLGLSWDPAILDHQKTARDRGVVATASYAQVTEPIYRHADGRWRHYEKHLEPILPTLDPWIQKFGYTR